MTARDIELRVANYFGWRRNVIVPNVSWGVGLHECDLLILSERNWATEVEIKISRSDLRADKKKPHGHRSDKIKSLWFAVPAELVSAAVALCPERAGILAIRSTDRGYGRFAVSSILDFYLEDDERWQRIKSEWCWNTPPHSDIGASVFVVRKPRANRGARAWTQTERLQLAQLKVLRYWGRRAA